MNKLPWLVAEIYCAPDQMNDLPNKYYLKAVSTHVGIPKLRESLEAELEYL